MQYNETVGTLLIKINADLLEISKTVKTYKDIQFIPKDEFHITTIGSELGGKLKSLFTANPELKDKFLLAISESNLEYFELQDELFYVVKDKVLEDSSSDRQTVLFQSIIQMVRVPGIEEFFDRLREISGLSIEVPPTHITLYTNAEGRKGIGLKDRTDLDRYVVSKLSWVDLQEDSGF